jgi:hypothetical protein
VHNKLDFSLGEDDDEQEAVLDAAVSSGNVPLYRL